MADGDVQHVYQNIKSFFGGNSELQKWMSDFSTSVDAWTICDRILGERKDALSCCFAAQTLRQKILKSLKEIPTESYTSLRESLINHLSHIHPTPEDHLGESTITQLCLAIADLYIQVPEWNNWIVSFLGQCASLTGDRTRMMLTLLKVFPEEMKSIRVGENRRNAIREELSVSGTAIIKYLENVLATFQSDEEIVKRVLQCMAAFLDNPSLSTDEIARGHVLQAAFQILTLTGISSSLHDAATECVVAAAIIAEDQAKHLALARSVQHYTYGLEEAYNLSVARDDLNQLQNYARVFTELNETLIEKIVNEPSASTDDLGCLKSLELLLLLAGHHDYSIIEKTFNVWYRISEALFMIEDERHLEQYKPYVNRYILALYRHARFDSDEDDLLDESHEFMIFRHKVSETVKDVVYLIGTAQCINMMYERLKICSSSPASTWDEMEAALFIIASVVHNVHPEEDSLISEIVAAITSLDISTHPVLIVTAIELLGGCDEWLEKHPDYHDKVLTWLLLLVANPKYSKYTTDSIEKVVTRSSRVLTEVFPHLMGHIAVLEKGLTRGREMELSIANLLKAATSIVVNLPPLEMRNCLNQMCEPIAIRLGEILTQESNGGTSGNEENVPATDSWEFVAKDVIVWVDRISAIFKQVKPWQVDLSLPPVPAPWTEIAAVLFERLQAVLNRYQSRQRIVEHACRSLRYLVRSLGPQSCLFLDPIIRELMAIYTNYPHSCILYLASILVDEYGAIEPARPGLMHMLKHLSSITFHLFEANGNINISMRDNPDTVDDLFRLAGRFVQRAPSFFFEETIAPEIFKYALIGLQIDHQEAHRSVTKFFTDITDQLTSARKKNYMDIGVQKAQEILNMMGPQLVASCLHSALFCVSGNLRRDLAEIIFIVSRYDSNRFKEWLSFAVSQLPKGGLAATNEQLQQFIFNITDNPLCQGSREVYNEIRDLNDLYN